MASIKANLKKGVTITFLTKYSSVLIELIVSAILARLLTPREFGVVAVIFFFLTFVNVLAESGLGPGIIQNKQLNDEDISSLFNLSLLIGLFATILFLALTPVFVWIYKDRIYIPLGAYISLIILLNAINIVPQSILKKDLEFITVGKYNILSNVIGGIAAVVLAFKGAGPYALISKWIFSSALMLILCMAKVKIKYTFRIRISSVKKILSFSLNQFAFNIINFLSRNIDNLLIGKFLGSTALAYYDKAYKLMKYPVDNLTFVIAPSLQPVLSNYQNDKPIIKDTFLKIIKFLAPVSLPMIPILYIFSEKIILLLYGGQWQQSVPLFKVLCITSGIQVLASTTGSFFQVLGRTDILFKVALFSSASIISGIVIGLQWGVLGVTYGYAIGYLITIIPTFYVLLKLLNSSFSELLETLYKPFIITAAIIITFYMISYFITLDNSSKFILTGAILSICYVVMLIATGTGKFLLDSVKR